MGSLALTTLQVSADSAASWTGAIATPDAAFILLLIGIYALLLEVVHPGTILPAIVGVICLVLAAIALSELPVEYGALALLLTGIVLMVAEMFTPGIGLLGLFGFAAFVGGSYFLFDPAAGGGDMRVSLPVIAGAAVSSAALTFFVVGAAIKARQRPPVTGAEELLSAEGSVVDWAGGSGHVRVHGEVWAARAEAPLKAGDRVRVAAREGLTLIVKAV